METKLVDGDSERARATPQSAAHGLDSASPARGVRSSNPPPPRPSAAPLACRRPCPPTMPTTTGVVAAAATGNAAAVRLWAASHLAWSAWGSAGWLRRASIEAAAPKWRVLAATTAATTTTPAVPASPCPVARRVDMWTSAAGTEAAAAATLPGAALAAAASDATCRLPRHHCRSPLVVVRGRTRGAATCWVRHRTGSWGCWTR